MNTGTFPFVAGSPSEENRAVMASLRTTNETVILTAVLLGGLMIPNLFAAEVIEETQTQVIVREHPKTGRPYISIVPREIPPDPFSGRREKFSRPDYRMLNPRVKAKDIPYDGPYSDRKKVYLLAASLAAVGTAGGVAGLAAAPAAAAGTGAAGGAGAYLTGAGAVAGTAAAASVYATTRSSEDNFIHRSESKEKPAPPLDNPPGGRA